METAQDAAIDFLRSEVSRMRGLESRVAVVESLAASFEEALKDLRNQMTSNGTWLKTTVGGLFVAICLLLVQIMTRKP